MNNKLAAPDIVGKIRNEMESLLNVNDNNMSDADTRLRYDDLASQKHSFTKPDNFNISQKNIQGRQIMLPTLSEITQKRANVILDLLSSNDDYRKNVQFDATGNWLVANQKRGNLRDLLHDTLTPSPQPRQIAYKDDWLRYLSENNIPEYLIKNAWVRNEVKNIKALNLPPSVSATINPNIATPTTINPSTPTMQRLTTPHLLGEESDFMDSTKKSGIKLRKKHKSKQEIKRDIATAERVERRSERLQIARNNPGFKNFAEILNMQ
jgi:hypothetical protein